MKRVSATSKTRDSLTDPLATLTGPVVGEALRGTPTRDALRYFALLPARATWTARQQ
jgi:hypothetical protein